MAGRSFSAFRPNTSRNRSVVLYKIGRPAVSLRPASAISSHSSSVFTTPSTLTPRIASISVRVTGWRYAMIARVSIAALDSFSSWVPASCRIIS